MARSGCLNGLVADPFFVSPMGTRLSSIDRQMLPVPEIPD